MKKTLFFCMLLFITVSAINAQSGKYQKAMTDNLKNFSESKNPQQLFSVVAAFERIATAEKTQWVPYYYAALALVRAGMNDPQSDKDALSVKVDELIANGEAIEKNADFYALRYMNATMQLLVNPMERWKTKGAEAEAAYQAGVRLNPGNASLYYLKGMSVLNTPEAFGGGKKNAKPFFEKAVKESKKVTTDHTFSPAWGGEEAQKELDKMQ